MVDLTRICFHCMSSLTYPDAPCPHCGALRGELRNQANQLPIGSILAGKYIVGCTLGQGGFGITYIGWDLNLDNKLAIKEFYPEGFVSRNNANQATVLPLSGERGAFFRNSREKFVEEARTLARFSSDPGIVSVHDFFNENGTSYIVMDFIDGKTLKRLAEERGGKLPAQEVLRYLLPVMDSLTNVHAAGLLHRDISPDNIIVRSSDDRAVLLDFGAARQISAMGEHSNTINVKHGFAPEEQYRTHGEQGPWTDVYALCATIYRLTTGMTPLPANDRIGPDGDTLAPITRLVVGMSSAQIAAITKGLSVWGKDRQQSMEELKHGIYTATKPIKRETPTDGLPKDGGKSDSSMPRGADVVREEKRKTREQRAEEQQPKRRRKWLLPAVAAVAVVVAAVGILVLTKPKAGVQVAAAGTDSAVTVSPVPTATPYTLALEEFKKLYTYESVEDGGIKIIDYRGTGTVVVPMYVGDKTVVAIGGLAFSSNNGLTSVKLPQSVTSIGEFAFWSCEYLTSIEMPGVTSISRGSFEDCTSLTSVELPDTVERISMEAFHNCTSLAEVKLPESLHEIGVQAFSGTPWFSKQQVAAKDGFIVLGNNAMHIYVGDDASVTVPEGARNVDFMDNEAVTSVTLPASMECINNSAFCGCSSLGTVNIPDSITSIGEEAFRYCDSLTSVEMPGVTSIGIYAFGYCDSLTSVEMPGVTSIGIDAFCNCISLSSVDMPSVTSLEEGAFADCSSLSAVDMPSVTSIECYAFYECKSLTSVEMPLVTSIGEKIFIGCKSLASVTIPESATSISDDAFGGCDALTIRCPSGSYAETYARKWGLKYETYTAD